MIGNSVHLTVVGLVLTSCGTGQVVRQRESPESFPNRKIVYRTEDRRHYEFHRYGDISYVRRADVDGPNRILVELENAKFDGLWTGFGSLPQLRNYKNSEVYLSKDSSKFHNVFVNSAAGLVVTSDASYSIPRDVSDSAYLVWLSSIEELIEEYNHVKSH